jgi:hypothetical protein
VITDKEYQRYKELGNLINNGADLDDDELAEFRELERKLYSRQDEGECPHKGNYIR